MTDTPIVTQLPLWNFAPKLQKSSKKQADLNTLWLFPQHVPEWITNSPTVMRCWELLAPLDWAHLPERNLQRYWGQVSIPYAAFVAACHSSGYTVPHVVTQSRPPIVTQSVPPIVTQSTPLVFTQSVPLGCLSLWLHSGTLPAQRKRGRTREKKMETHHHGHTNFVRPCAC